MNLDSISTFLRFAALAGFFRLWWQVSGLWIGADASTRVAALLGMGLALTFAAPVLRRISQSTGSFWKRRSPELLFASSWALCLLPFFVGFGSWALNVDREFSIGIVLLHAAAFAPASLFVRRSLDRSAQNMPACLLGLAGGVFVHETILLPSIGWGWSEPLWAALLVFSCAISPQSTQEEEEDRWANVARVSALFCGLALGLLLSTTALFLEAQLSSTRWSAASMLGISLLGLALGALLVASWRNKALPDWIGVFAVVLGSATACWMTWQALHAMAGADPFAQKILSWQIPPVAQEILICLEAMGIGTVILGASLQLVKPRRLAISLFLLGIGGGFGARSWLLEVQDEKGQPLLASLVPHPPGSQNFEQKLTEDGILRRVRTVAEGNTTTIRWNRDAMSRQSEWLALEQEEIFLPARLHPQATRALAIGTPFGSHRTAIALSGVTQVEIADPLPAFLGQDKTPPASARLAATPLYDWICLLSSPKLAENRGLTLTEDFFRLAARALRPGGCLVVWTDLRALPQEELGTLLRSYLSVFPQARLWIGQDLYAGPLLALESGTVDIGKDPESGLMHFVAQGAKLAAIAGVGAKNTLLRPRIEMAAPLLPPPMSLPRASQLRALASLLAPTTETRTGFFYFLDSLAIHAEEQAPGSAFSGRLERIRVSQDEAEQATVGLELHPDSKPLQRHLESLGNMLLEKRDPESYQHALRFFPRWMQAVPENRKFPFLLARAHHDLLDDAIALPFAEKAVALGANEAQAHELLGDIQGKLHRWKEAVDSYATANAILPQAPKLAKKLGLAQLELGEWGLAQDWLQRAAIVLPGDKEIQQALEKISGRK